MSVMCLSKFVFGCCDCKWGFLFWCEEVCHDCIFGINQGPIS